MMKFRDPICGMEVSEKEALKLSLDNKTYYFCSQHCLNKFAEQHNLSQEKIASCCLGQPRKAWYKNKALVVAFILVVLYVLSYFMPFLKPFRMGFVMYLDKIWWAVLLGLILGGVIDHFIPREYISSVLASPKKRTILYSVILGFFMSACSHGILALSIEIHKKGASNPAVVAFLLASPWANLPLTIMLVGFFGLKGFYIIISAIIIAIITGLIFQALERRNLIEVNKNIVATDKDFSIFQDLKQRIRAYRFSLKQLKSDINGVFSGAISLADMVLWWILIGIGLASLAGAYIPQNLFHHYMGPTALGLLITLVLATIIEVCSEGTAPLAFEIYRQTGALGNSFVFLMAGVVTDYTEIGLLWHNVGKKTAIWLPIIAVPQVVALGYLANLIFK